MPIGCAVNITFYKILVVRTAIPLVIIGLLALAGWLMKSRDKARLSNMFYSACFFLIFLLYPGCTSTAFATFNCSPLDDGSRYLRIDADIDCNHPFHTTMEAYASVMIGASAVTEPRVAVPCSVSCILQ